MSLRIEGASRLRATLRDLSATQEAAVKRELMRSALAIQAGAKQRAPVDSGRLKNSIATEARDGGMTQVIGTNVEYAPHVEFGTRFMSARPYLFPAFEQERPKLVNRLRTVLEEAP